MKQTVCLNQFIQAFERAGRGKQFSCEGLEALYEHITELEDDIGKELELDVIELCCYFNEYPDLMEAYDNYTFNGHIDDFRAWLENQTSIIDLPSGRLIIRVF